MLELVRIASLSGYTTVAKRLGLDYPALLKELGLTPSLMTHPEQVISAVSAVRLLEKSAALSNCPTFGLQVANERTLADLGMVSVLIALQPTLGDLFDCFDRYRHLILPIMTINVERHEAIAVIGLDLAIGSAERHRQANDLLLGAAVLAARAIFVDDWDPLSVHFAYPEPADADIAMYRKTFRCDLEFNASFFGMTTSCRDLDRQHEHVRPLAHHAEELVIRALRPGRPNVAQTVQNAVMHLLPTSNATLETAAAALHMHPRTLQRRLDEEGYTFRELVNQARIQLAARLLSNPSTKIADIAEALGYSSSGAFSRWYAREFGEPPTQQREYLLQ